MITSNASINPDGGLRVVLDVSPDETTALGNQVVGGYAGRINALQTELELAKASVANLEKEKEETTSIRMSNMGLQQMSNALGSERLLAAMYMTAVHIDENGSRFIVPFLKLMGWTQPDARFDLWSRTDMSGISSRSAFNIASEGLRSSIRHELSKPAFGKHVPKSSVVNPLT